MRMPNAKIRKVDHDKFNNSSNFNLTKEHLKILIKYNKSAIKNVGRLKRIVKITVPTTTLIYSVKIKTEK